MKKKALTIGTFDGVHLGHQQLFKILSSLGSPTQAITFSNHPHDILNPTGAPLSLTPLPLKRSLLSAYGIEESVVIPFTQEIASLTYTEFLAPYQIEHLVIGEDAAIGHGRLGTPEALRLLGLQRGFRVHVVPKLRREGEQISSTKIRSLISKGDLLQAELLLGRPHCFVFSSANLYALLPPDGRYQVWAYSPGGVIPTTLHIENRIPRIALEKPQLVSFGLLNPSIFDCLCHPISLAEL